MLKKLLLLLVSLSFSLQAAPNFKRDKKICLNMIVKNEAPVIERCLNSLKGLIDYWVIVDTGSKDGTQDLIKKCLKDIPGKLYERPWEDFEVNRNQALKYSKNKGDYILLIDADEWLIFEDSFKLPKLDKDFYAVTDRCANIDNKTIFLINNHLDWYWKGAIHEDILCDTAQTRDLITDVIKFEYANEGNRSQDSQKYQKDVVLIEKELEKNPESTRYVFYLGETCTQIHEYEKALKAFEKRIAMGGWPEELFWAYYRIATLKESLNRPSEEVIKAYCQAHVYRPIRAEPLYRLGCYYQKNKQYLLAYLALKEASSMPMPKEKMFMEHFVYSYGALIALADCSCMIGNLQETTSACKKLLERQGLPEDTRKQIEQNLKWAQQNLANQARAQVQIQ